MRTQRLQSRFIPIVVAVLITLAGTATAQHESGRADASRESRERAAAEHESAGRDGPVHSNERRDVTTRERVISGLKEVGGMMSASPLGIAVKGLFKSTEANAPTIDPWNPPPRFEPGRGGRESGGTSSGGRSTDAKPEREAGPRGSCGGHC